MSLASNMLLPFARLFTTLALLGMLSSGLFAQQNYGTILGTVTDPTGAVVPDAKITVTNTATALSREAVTDKDGFFQVLSLPIGNYTVAVEKAGFKKQITQAKTLLINQNLRMDMTLEIGSQAEVVSVEGQTTGVETVSSTLGQSIPSRPIVDLPLNGRNVLDLALLQPGVAPADNPGQGGAASANTAFSVSGGRNDSTTFLLDGGVNNNLLNNGVVFNPNPDSISEYKILTNNFSAEYGRNGGGVVTVVTKSGTNTYHGSAYDYNRNDAYNANSFFNNRQGAPRNVLKRNQYGATFGGPILRDKLFAFVAYQGQRQKEAQSSIVLTTFTPAEIQGDFSGSVNKARIVSFLQAHPFFQPNAALAAQGIMDPSKIDPVAQAYIKAGLIPVSAAPRSFQGAAQDNRDEVTAKFDWNPNEKDKFTVTLGRNGNSVLTPFVSLTGSAAPGFPTTTNRHQQFANIAYTRIFSANLLNEFRMTAQRGDTLQAVPAAKLPTSKDLGIGITSDNPTGPSRLTFTGLSVGFSIQGPTSLIDNTFGYSDTVSWTKGKHNMKFGGSFLPYQDNTLFDFIINGSFSFNSTNNARDPHANFLLGLPFSFQQFPAAPSNIRSKATYFFGQDEWHVASNLTLTYGLRYEYSTPKQDTAGRSFSLIPGQKSTVFPNAPVGLVFPGDKGAPEGANFPDKNDFAPRFGFAWQPFHNTKTSVRGGIGVFYDILKAEDNLQFNGQPPFFSFASFSFPTTIGAGPYTFLKDPFTSTGNPNSFPSKPVDHNIDITKTFGSFGGSGLFFVDPNLRTPYTYQYNLSVQHELPDNLVLQTAYVGTTSHKLTALMDVSPFDPTTLGSTTPHRIQNEVPGNTDKSFSFLEEFRNTSDANYNSLQIGVTKPLSPTRFLGNTYFTLAYTYAHNIDNASGFRETSSTVPFFQPHIFRASSDIDLRHVFAFSGGWDLPFNRGPQKLVKGWSLYPIITYRTGYPLNVTADQSTSQSTPGPSGAGDAGLVNANLVGPIQYFDPHLEQTFGTAKGLFLFNPKSFDNSKPTPPYGTAARNLLRGPKRTNMNLALAKATPVYGEHVNVEFRAEAFNIFNHTQFRSVSTNPDSATFGQVTSAYDPRILQFGLHIKF
jgi:outer membrane receptor protein involved in Fe transport